MRRIRMGRLYLLLSLILLEACSSVDQVFAEATTAFSAGPTVLTVEREKHLGHTAGSEFRECAIGCPIMVIIPAGKHTIGSPEDEGGRTKGERPQHEVTIAKPFVASEYGVTFDQWDACVAAAACPLVIDAWGRKNMPVINVSWGDAKLFVAWLSRLTGKEYRLLTEAEWEYAARAGSNTRYSWGDEPGSGRANCSGCGGAWTLQTAPVGSFRPNAFGLHDMEGNVWEWVDDIWYESHQGTPANGAAELQDGDPT
jgi:formylglycine-generating enzyme required for sulfatase activity